MQAVYYDQFGITPRIEQVPDPRPADAGVVIKVEATGLCRSDWHGWMGHDPDIALPHVPGHELAGTIEETGSGVSRWRKGERVTVPFVCGCGRCGQCVSGNHQVCDNQFQPGFTHWGSFATYVAIDYADVNLVQLPDEVAFVTAASLGCRFATAFRAVVFQGRVGKGDWVAVHGCGGVGLSSIMVATALGANVIAIDIIDDNLKLAASVGAVEVVNARRHEDVVELVRDKTAGGAHISIDALGSVLTCGNSIACLRKRGRHVQIGLMTEDAGAATVPMSRVIANELEILGSHGMQAHAYPQMLAMIQAGSLQPDKLIGNRIALTDAPLALASMHNFGPSGITVIDKLDGQGSHT